LSICCECLICFQIQLRLNSRRLLGLNTLSSTVGTHLKILYGMPSMFYKYIIIIIIISGNVLQSWTAHIYWIQKQMQNKLIQNLFQSFKTCRSLPVFESRIIVCSRFFIARHILVLENILHFTFYILMSKEKNENMSMLTAV
jgi:hypothetical protein